MYKNIAPVIAAAALAGCAACADPYGDIYGRGPAASYAAPDEPELEETGPEAPAPVPAKPSRRSKTQSM